MILVTGSSGLVGRYLCAALEAKRIALRRFDIRRAADEDIVNADSMQHALAGITGIVHLAAVSRVVDAERDPDHCRRVNVEGTRVVLDAAMGRMPRPWVIFISSREVYGNPDRLPVSEDAPHRPLNAYARSKSEGERTAEDARRRGLHVNICRLGTVYGCLDDYADRVLPAFCRAAAFGGSIHIHGNHVRLDPTHVDDVVKGLTILIERTAAGAVLPPIHLVSGQGPSLRDLADMAVRAGKSGTKIIEEPARSFDVSGFVGDPRRAAELLGWRSEITIEAGVAAYVRAFGDSSRR